jgi:hypothetical protein
MENQTIFLLLIILLVVVNIVLQVVSLTKKTEKNEKWDDYSNFSDPSYGIADSGVADPFAGTGNFTMDLQKSWGLPQRGIQPTEEQISDMML